MSLVAHPFVIRFIALLFPLGALAAVISALAPGVVPEVLPPPALDPAACAAPDARPEPPKAKAQRVLLISVDGLRPDAITALGPGSAPAFHRLRSEGATTDNARNDFDLSYTLPNHTSQLTGRGVGGRCGHNWTGNSNPAPGETLHTNKGTYVASVFDVAHDHGLRTVAFASKAKFRLFEASYDSVHGAPDLTGLNDGQDKLDRFVFESDTEILVEQFIDELRTTRFGFGFLHLRDPDSRGHRRGWEVRANSPYLQAVQQTDRHLGDVLAAIEADSLLSVSTVVIVTSDHGGVGGRIREGHGDAWATATYTIPFYVWGAGVEPGVDLYALNTATRSDPGRGRPGYGVARQPVRNGDAANLALDLLGLPRVPGSHVNPHTSPLRVDGIER